jgi:hypothetical protein
LQGILLLQDNHPGEPETFVDFKSTDNKQQQQQQQGAQQPQSSTSSAQQSAKKSEDDSGDAKPPESFEFDPTKEQM